MRISSPRLLTIAALAWALGAPGALYAQAQADAQNFMFNSGQSVQAAMKFYKIDPVDVIVFHDELDLAPGRVKCKTGGGHAGHNGLRSINQHCGPDFRRVRIGIGHPGARERVHGHVLGNYAKSEMDPLAEMLAGIAAEAEWLAKGDDPRFMSDLALRQ
mgnify:CR=1 FL=1